jgi:MinD-like ATPase involved in chromosome partitioning or flagellar assembly
MASGGLVNLGAGKHEQTLRDWSALIKSNIPGNYQIAAVSVKGGVGKTRVTAGVGSVFAVERAQPVLAIDGNPTYGGLGRYIDSTAWTSIRDFLASKEQVVDYPTARRFTGRNKQGLEVLAGNQNTASPMPLDAQTFFDTVGSTRRFYQLCLVDCGTEVETDFFKAILSVSDALMIVGSCGVDGGLAIEQTVNWLAARGGHELLKRSVIVLDDANDSLDKHFEAHIRETVGNRVRSVHTIPWDPHLRDGADLDYGALRKRTRLAFMELAADLAHGFPTAGALTQ